MSDITAPAVRIADTGPGTGRGVFAERSFEPHEIVEVAPVLVLPDGQQGLPTGLKQRTFCWGKLTGFDDGSEAMVWGYGSLYNHANPANLSYRADADTETMVFVAARHIAQGEQLTINYEALGGGPVSDGDGWQQRHGVSLR